MRNEESRAEFSQKGKKLDLSLTKGSLFFDVSKPPASTGTVDDGIITVNSNAVGEVSTGSNYKMTLTEEGNESHGLSVIYQ
ncbi:MAG: hypothetical protein K6G03_02030 [Lachnospiraceae bacterium]|nr:hypothetical protein [Lachnospiraceae bacterium]